MFFGGYGEENKLKSIRISFQNKIKMDQDGYLQSLGFFFTISLPFFLEILKILPESHHPEVVQKFVEGQAKLGIYVKMTPGFVEIKNKWKWGLLLIKRETMSIPMSGCWK
jgi:hypothetical protein